MDRHIEIIKCCECGKIQEAEVLYTIPWPIYVHQCSCGYIIMESEWDRMKLFKKQAARLLKSKRGIYFPSIRSYCRTTKKAEIKTHLEQEGIKVEIR